LLVSLGSYLTARESLTISKKNAAAREPKIIPEIQNAYTSTINNARVYIFSIALKNPADIDNTITKIELRITYKRKDGTIGNLLLPHDKNLISKLTTFSDHLPIVIPCNIQAHNAVEGTVLCKLPDAHIPEAALDTYKIYLHDAHEMETIITPTLIKGYKDARSDR
jgi:hypothetical protein